MRRVLLGVVLASFATALLAGCDPAPSTPIAPAVKEPDNRNVSGDEILRRKLAGDSQKK